MITLDLSQTVWHLVDSLNLVRAAVTSSSLSILVVLLDNWLLPATLFHVS